MADPLSRAQPGKRQHIPVDAYNAFVEAAQSERIGRYGRGPDGDGARLRDLGNLHPGIILVKNTTGNSYSQLAVVEPVESVFGGTVPFATQRTFQRQVLMTIRTPTADHGTFAILLDPLKPNAIGRAVVSGAAPARVVVSGGETGYTIAAAKSGQTSLRAMSRGDARNLQSWAEILWKSSGTSDSSNPNLAVIRFAQERRSNVSAGRVYLSSTTTLTSPIPWTGTSYDTLADADYWSAGQPTRLTVPTQGYYQLQLHVAISSPAANTTFETWFQDSSANVYGRQSQYIGAPLATYLASHAFVSAGASEYFTAHITASAWSVGVTSLTAGWTLHHVGGF